MSEKVDLKKTYLAIVTMLLAVLCVDLYMVVVKFLGDDYSVIQLALFRNASAIIPLFLLLLFTKEHFLVFKNVNKKFYLLSLLRGICFLSMNIFVFISVINLQFATAMTLTFSSPFFIVILSIIFLRDKVGINYEAHFKATGDTFQIWDPKSSHERTDVIERWLAEQGQDFDPLTLLNAAKISDLKENVD